MFSKKLEFITAKFCIVFLISIFALTFIRILSRTIILKTDRELPFGKIIFFDREDLQIPDSELPWRQYYPFEETEPFFYNNEEVEYNIKNNKSPEIIQLKFNKISKSTERIHTWVTSNFIFRNNLINFCSIINSTLKWKPHAPFFTGDKFIELRNGHFISLISRGDVTEKTRSLNLFNKFLKTKNIPFLYVQAPCKISPNDNTINGIYDFSNENTDIFLQKLSLYNINFIDMRKEIEKTGKDFYSFFYKTDHHWTAEAGLWATKIITKKLNNDFNLKIDVSIFNEENFNYTTYEQSFFGSHGRTRKLPLKYMEDITLIEPKENYSLTTNIYSSNKIIREAHGGFETLIFMEHLQNINNAYTDNAYAIYVDGDTIMQITNHSSKSKSRILILGDSFTDVVEPFLSLGVEQLDCLDLRVFDGSLRTWIDTHKHYDVCIFLINAGAVAGEINKTNHTDLWDFR